jgi:hypothetical protein
VSFVLGGRGGFRKRAEMRQRGMYPGR